MHCSSMSPPDVNSIRPEHSQRTTSASKIDRRAAELKGSMLYFDITDLNEKLELQNKLINSLEGENRLLKLQLSTKENDIQLIKKETELLKKQLTEARQKLQHHENVQNTSNELCRAENCIHLRMLRNLNLEAKTEDISVQIRESENLAQDLHLKLGKVLVALNALGSGIELLQPKQVSPQEQNGNNVGLSDGELVISSPCLAISNQCLEPPEIKIEEPESPPPALPSTSLVLGASQDASSSSSSTDVRDSLEVILQALPQSNSQKGKRSVVSVLSDEEEIQVTHESYQTLIELRCISCKLNFSFSKEEAACSLENGETFKCTACKKHELHRSARNTDEASIPKSNKIFKCSVCNKVFHFPSKLKNHLRTHTGEKPFHCNVCGKSFSLSFNLKIHYRTHSGERPFACEACGKNFRQSKSLLYHNCSHSLRKNPLQCKICKKTFDATSFRGHPCVQAKQHSCAICGKNFQSLALLTAHAATHGGKQGFSCDSCGEAYSLPSELKKHWCAGTYKQTEGQSNMSAESGYFSDSRIFKCVVCAETFAEPALLLKHQLIHQAEGSSSTVFQSSKNYSVSVVTSNTGSPRGSPINLGKKQVSDLLPAKNVLNRLITKDERRDGKQDGSPHQQPEFYDISELAMLKSYSDSGAL